MSEPVNKDDNLSRLFQRRERKVGAPQRPRPASSHDDAASVTDAPADTPTTAPADPAVTDTAASVKAGLMADEAALSPPTPSAYETQAQPPARPRQLARATQKRRPAPARTARPATLEPTTTKRNSIFLSEEQARWIKAVRGRLMVAGREVNASEIVRLAVDRLREAGLKDEALYTAILGSRPELRSHRRQS